MQMEGMFGETGVDDAPADVFSLGVFEGLGVGVRLSVDADDFEALLQNVFTHEHGVDDEHTICRNRTGRIDDEGAVHVAVGKEWWRSGILARLRGSGPVVVGAGGTGDKAEFAALACGEINSNLWVAGTSVQTVD